MGKWGEIPDGGAGAGGKAGAGAGGGAGGILLTFYILTIWVASTIDIFTAN